MKAWIVPSGISIEPFGHGPDQVPVLTKPWGQRRTEYLARCGITEFTSAPLPGEELLVIRDDVIFSQRYLELFLKSARKGQRAVSAGLGKCQFLTENLPLQEDTTETEDGVGFMMAYFPKGEGDLTESRPILCVPAEELLFPIRFPPQYFGTEVVQVPVCASRIMHVQHWIHIQRVNQAAMLGYHVEQWQKHKLWYLGRVLLAHSVNKYKVMARLNRKGKKCDIHPSAIIEGSVIGNNVKIGAGAIVRLSVLADGVQIADSTHVELCLLSPGATVHKGGKLAFCTLYPNAVTAIELLHYSVLGERCILNTGSFVLDLNFKEEIKVMTSRGLQSCGSRYIGCAVGADVVLGAGTWIASGRAIPPGALVIKRPEELLARPPREVDRAAVYVIRDGALEQLKPA